MTLLVRPSRPEDYRAMNADLPEAFDLGGRLGYAGERNGRCVALGTITIDRWGRYWGWFNKIEQVSPFTMHRLAVKTIEQLREIEAEIANESKASLYAIANLAEPGSEKWLKRLGFVHQPELTHELGPIYRCDLIRPHQE